MVYTSRGRQFLLLLAAAVFLVVGVRAVISPHAVAREFGFALTNVKALNEFRAVYVGVWFASAILLIVGAVRINQTLIGDLCAILILGQTFGRLLSFLLDGFPGLQILPIFFLELLGGFFILVVRPNVVKL